MDDYVEPKDSKKFLWGDLNSPLSTNKYSDDEDDDSYSLPYQPVPGPAGPKWQSKAATPPVSDISEVSDRPSPSDSASIYNTPSTPVYDVPPTPDDDYNHLNFNGASPRSPVSAVKPGGEVGDEDAYTQVPTRPPVGRQRQVSGGSPNPGSPSRSVLSSSPTAHVIRRQESNDSPFKTGAAAQNPSVSRQSSQESNRMFTRQRAIYPRKGSSGGGSGLPETRSSAGSGEAVYEEAWDTARKQKKLEENLRLARTISASSETFEDALEYLPEDWTPTRLRAGRKLDSDSGAGEKKMTVDPVTGGDYEQAWDLNRGLEEKLRSLQMMPQDSDSGDGGGDLYQEPWDTAKRQRALEERIQKAKSGGGSGGQGRSPQHQSSVPHSHQSHSPTVPRGGGIVDLYEEAWDSRGLSLTQILQSSRSIDGSGGSAPGSPRSSYGATSGVGEPVNAMIPLQNQEWYHGNISRDDAEKMLRVCKDGSYLVRDSSDRCHYTLSIKSPRMTIHIQIDHCQKSDGSRRYILGKNSKAFPTIPSMIDYYVHHVVPIKGAEHMTLRHPVLCKYSESAA